MLDLVLEVFNSRFRRVLDASQNETEHERTSLLDGVMGHAVFHALCPERPIGVILWEVKGELEIFLHVGVFWVNPGIVPGIASCHFSNVKSGTVSGSEEIAGQRVLLSSARIVPVERTL